MNVEIIAFVPIELESIPRKGTSQRRIRTAALASLHVKILAGKRYGHSAFTQYGSCQALVFLMFADNFARERHRTLSTDQGNKLTFFFVENPALFFGNVLAAIPLSGAREGPFVTQGIMLRECRTFHTKFARMWAKNTFTCQSGNFSLHPTVREGILDR
jgi:hypothetical protein